MVTQTIREAILDNSRLSPGYVYVVRDGDVIFYVGMSDDPTLRLCQHLGLAHRHELRYSRGEFIEAMEQNIFILADTAWCASPIGSCIRDNAPESLGWSFDIYETQDAIDVVERAGLPQVYPHIVKSMQTDWYEQRTIVERELIDQLKPCLNDSLNRHTRNIPVTYRQRVINLNDSAVDYLDF